MAATGAGASDSSVDSGYVSADAPSGVSVSNDGGSASGDDDSSGTVEYGGADGSES